METSDSECFESADEDFSNDEDTVTVRNSDAIKSNESEGTNVVEKITQQVEALILPSEQAQSVTASVDDNKNKDTAVTPISNPGEHIEETNANEVRERENRRKKNEKQKDAIPIKEPEEIKEVEADLWGDDEDWEPQESNPPPQTNKDEESNMWENDDWEPIENDPHHPEEATRQSWGGWGNWDVSSLINTASQGVSSLMGAPDPEELARINREKSSEEPAPPPADHRNSSFGLGNLVMGVSHLTKLVESTSTKVISGGLDTLETIGKKTMEVLQDGDPGLKKKRAFLKIDQHKPVLSQLLREAKEKSESDNKALEDKHYSKRAKNYETLFDDHQGLVHLEALEMLSKQCDIKLQSLLESYSNEDLVDLQETMDQVKELCELPDEDDEDLSNFTEIQEKLESLIKEINIPITYKRLVSTWEETDDWLKNLKLELCDEREIHQQAIETLAQLTAIAVEQFHKAGELLLVKEHRSTADEADCLVQLTTNIVALISIVAGKFTDKLNSKSSSSNQTKESVNGLITNVFFEAANSSSYVQDAFQLLIPVLQVGAV